MPAPFVIAHLQVANLLEQAGASLAKDQRAQVFLTNALTGWESGNTPQPNLRFPDFTAERDAAEAVKQADTILVIRGNPPYNGYAGIALGEEERDLTKFYKRHERDTLAPEAKGLNDLYIRFFRIAERRVIGSDGVVGNRDRRGIVSLITNYSWLVGFSHPTMRTYLLNNFTTIKVDNLNGDKFRTGKTTPNCEPDPSAFSTPTNREGIQTGTAITFLVKSSNERATHIQLRQL